MWKEVKTLFNPHSIYSNLFNLSRMREIGLKKSIEIASGQICALIHPFYEPRPGSDDDKIVSNEALRKWQEQRFMQIILTSPSTVFIFEEAGKIVNTASVLHQSDNKTPVCFIPTEPSSPLPRIPPYIMQDSHIEFDEVDPDKVVWNFTSTSLSRLGVQDILLTGRTYPGCASAAEERLGERFNVTVLPETFPQYYLTI